MLRALVAVFGMVMATAKGWRKAQRESVEMSRRRVLQEIEMTRSEVHRASLEQALAFLDRQIEELSDGTAS